MALVLAACGSGSDGSSSSTAVSDAPAADVREWQSADGLRCVGYTPTPDPIPFDALFSLEWTVDDCQGGALEDAEWVVDAQMPDHSHGMTVTPVSQPAGDGAWVTEGLLFHMEGWWRLTAEGGGQVAEFDITCCS